MSRLRTTVLLILILAIAALSRFYHLHHYSYFFDEAWNDELSAGRGSAHIQLPDNVIHRDVPKPTSLDHAAPWFHIWTHMDYVTHPPLYIIVLRCWRDVFGESPRVSRACSVTISTLAILLLFDCVRLFHGTTAALWACAIMALAGAQIELAQEVRPYALMLFMSLGALAELARVEKLGATRWRCAILGAWVLGMVLTHYFAAPAALAIGAYILIRFRGKVRRDAFVALLIAAAVYAIIWGPFFWQQRSYFAAATEMWMREDSAGHVMRDLVRLAEVPLRLLIEPPQGTFPGGYAFAALLLLPFLLLYSGRGAAQAPLPHRASGSDKASPSHSDARLREGEAPSEPVSRKTLIEQSGSDGASPSPARPDMLIWCIWLFGTIFFIAAMDLARCTQHLSFIRYSLIGSPAIYAPLAAMFPATVSRRWIAHVVPACIVIACIGSLPEAYEVPKQEYRQLASYLDNNVTRGDVVAFYSPGDTAWYASAMYLNTCFYSKSYPWAFVKVTHPPDGALLDQLKQAHAVWLITSIASDMSGEKLMPGSRVDAAEGFPFVGTCQRITSDPSKIVYPAVPPKQLDELR